MVYIISDGIYTKIGKTDNEKTLRNRVATLQTGNALELKVEKAFKGSYKLESLLHKHLKDYKVSGEWFFIDFDITEELIEGFKYQDSREVMNSIESQAEISYRVKNKIEDNAELNISGINEEDIISDKDFLEAINTVSSEGKYITSRTVVQKTGMKYNHYSAFYKRYNNEIRKLNIENTGFSSWYEFKKDMDLKNIERFCQEIIDTGKEVSFNKLSSMIELSAGQISKLNAEHGFKEKYNQLRKKLA